MVIDHETKRNAVVLLFLFIALIFHSIGTVFYSSRMPNTTPLPDLGLDLFPRIPVLLTICEIFAALQLLVFLTILFFRPDRMIILRRFFILYSLLLYLRTIFFLGTQASQSSETMSCSDRVDLNQNSMFGIGVEILKKAVERLFNFRVISSFEPNEACVQHYLSMQTILTLLVYNFILKYVFGDSDLVRDTETESWSSIAGKSFYWLVTAISASGVLFAGYGYSMDVVLAFYITNQIFAMYHTMCFPGIDWREKPQTNPLDDQFNEMTNFWWWPLFEYIELNDP